MDHAPESNQSSVCWFVGASFWGNDDQASRFLSEGIWENGYEDRYHELVRSMRTGDRIAIKAAYTRKNHLPFENRGQTVSVMAIKATGTILENAGDGKRVRVDWKKVEPNREWYFFTNRQTVWRVTAEDWATEALIAFAFDGKDQDLDRFLDEPKNRARFGVKAKRFPWTTFYQAVAEKLLTFRSDRTPLIEGIHQLQLPTLGYLTDEFPDGSNGPLKDICPFTAMGTFNRSMTVPNRKSIAQALAGFLGIEIPVPDSFEGIPVLNNQNSWFFNFSKKRQPKDIDLLWEIFEVANEFLQTEGSNRNGFMEAFDQALTVWGVSWNLTVGLYWTHPWDFPTLDGNSRNYIEKFLGLKILSPGQKGPCRGFDYLKTLDTLKERFREENFPVNSFPELSLEAWLYEDPVSPAPQPPPEAKADSGASGDVAGSEGPVEILPFHESYSVHDIVADGCFLPEDDIERMLERLRTKKNLILQGPPGTGKTWLAKRLAFALIGHKDHGKVRAVQFHPNLSYEDFVRGWRPAGDGKLALVDGVFIEMVKAAVRDSTSKYVVVIEEINRGNPAQIFGELLTLLEAGKRTPSEALELCYPDPDGQNRRTYVPENLYVIGTMNIADRSLALVDLALRRRFAFVDLEPRLGERWREWVIQKTNLERELVVEIEARINALNDRVAGDPRLGGQFRIGHSYVTPTQRVETGKAREWFRLVVETEIGPLLEEYWFDAPEEARKARTNLLKDW